MFGEIFIAQFPFTSGTMSKVRPVLLLFDLLEDVIVCRVSSAQHSGPLDVVLTGWQAAGLLKPSIARLDRLVTAEKSVLLRPLGCLCRPAWLGYAMEPAHEDEMSSPNQSDAVNPAIAPPRFHVERQWRGVTDPHRSATQPIALVRS